MSNSHLEYHLQLLNHLRTILVAVGDAEQVPDESHALFIERFDELLTQLVENPLQSQYLGQDLLCQVIQRYPQIAHLVPRDLLWFFGGDCLHYMPDDEMDVYQQLEERRYDAEQSGRHFDWHEERQLLSSTSASTHH
ncbi:PA2817 family protein [Pseudomonas sp.]|uniref:PA2817 family protein n=1 Tax=Pseudomonas sp. TaxID=306 RepID=UPI0028AB4135|nr:PA2817 family protein [Pseudomonas sp.]